MPATVNPQSNGTHRGRLDATAAAVRAGDPPPRRSGYAWGLLLARMEERALLPGEPARTRLVWGTCRERFGSRECAEPGECRAAGKCLAGGNPVLLCACGGTLIVLGDLEASEGVRCEACGARDAEAQRGDIDPRATARIAEWNTMIEQRIERRKPCDTPYGWLARYTPPAVAPSLPQR